MERRFAILAVVFLGVLAACNATATVAPASVAAETPSPDEAEAIRFRTSFGLRSDLAFVRFVAANPAASSREYGVPLMPAEIAELNARAANEEAVLGVIRAYVAEHRDESGGLYIDQEHDGAVKTLWTANLEAHAAAIRALVRPGSRIAFRAAGFTEAELNALHDRISADLDWMRAVGIAPVGVSDDVVGNRVEVLISSADPDAPSIVAAHYGAPPGMLIAISDGTGAALIPIATIRGRVITAGGGAPGDNTFMVVTRGPGPGRCGGDIDEMGHGVAPDGAFEILCAAGRWTIAIQDAPIAGPNGADLGSLDVLVPEGGVIDIVIPLEP